MVYDNVVYIDSNVYCEGQYQYGDELCIVLCNGGTLILQGVSESEYNYLYQNPAHETVVKLIQKYGVKRSHR